MDVERRGMSADGGVQIEGPDVVRVVLQFVREQGWSRSFAAMQEESGVQMTAIGGREALAADVRMGRWESVLQAIEDLHLPPEALSGVHECMVLELLENGQRDAAKALLYRSPVFAAANVPTDERHSRLQALVTAPLAPLASTLYSKESRESLREKAAKSLLEAIPTAPPGRLLELLGQALKWQIWTGRTEAGAHMNLFQGESQRVDEREDRVSDQFWVELRPNGGLSSVTTTSVAFLADRRSVVLGNSDGFLELWDYTSQSLRSDVAYQAEDRLMMHSASVGCLCFSADATALASGSGDGAVKVWDVSTGTCLRRFPGLHPRAAVSSLQFSPSGTELLSASTDGSMALLSLASSTVLGRFMGHHSFVHTVVWVDSSRLVSASADGEVRWWDVGARACVATRLPLGELAVQKLLRLPGTDWVAVVGRCARIPVLDARGERQFALEAAESPSRPCLFMDAALSPRGRLLYALADSGWVHVFDLLSRSEVHAFQALPAEICLGIVHHPVRNLVAVYSSNDLLRVFKGF